MSVYHYLAYYFGMFSKKIRPIIITIVILIYIGRVDADNRYLTLSSSAGRSLSLTCPAALEGYIAEVPINPAGFKLFKDVPAPRFAVYLNPLSAFIAFKGLQEGEYGNGVIDSEDLLIPALLLFKGFALSYRALNVGLVMSEQLPNGDVNKRLFHYFPVYDDYYNRLFLRLELDERVAIGVSAEMFTVDEKNIRVGYSYGVILKPGKLNVGVFYSMLPDGYEEALLPNIRLVDETVNAGLSWQPNKMVKCFTGLRNISEESRPAFLEPHSGLEVIPWKHAALRAGYYYEKDEGNVFSFGLGLLDINDFRPMQNHTEIREFLLDYGLVMLPGDIALHSVAVHFRI